MIEGDNERGSEIEYEVGGDVPAIGVEAGTGHGTSAYSVAEAEAIAGGNLDEVDDVDANAQVPSGLDGLGLHLPGI